MLKKLLSFLQGCRKKPVAHCGMISSDEDYPVNDAWTLDEDYPENPAWELIIPNPENPTWKLVIPFDDQADCNWLFYDESWFTPVPWE